MEDDAPTRDVVTFVLEHHGLEVVKAENGSTALEAIRRRAPDIILLDMWMPVLDGAEFVKRYRQMEVRQAPIILMTARNTAEALARQVGADCLLKKPFDLTELEQAIESCLGPGFGNRESDRSD